MERHRGTRDLEKELEVGCGGVAKGLLGVVVEHVVLKAVTRGDMEAKEVSFGVRDKANDLDKVG